MIITKQNTINNQAVVIQLQEGIKNLFRISNLLIQAEKFSQVALKLDQHLQDPLKKSHSGTSPTKVCWSVYLNAQLFGLMKTMLNQDAVRGITVLKSLKCQRFPIRFHPKKTECQQCSQREEGKHQIRKSKRELQFRRRKKTKRREDGSI